MIYVTFDVGHWSARAQGVWGHTLDPSESSRMQQSRGAHRCDKDKAETAQRLLHSDLPE